MFQRGIFAGIVAAASLGMVIPASAAMGAQSGLVEVAPSQRRQGKLLAPGAPRKYRNRWKAERRAKRPNLNHVSKRTRRKHRRARKAA